jgi:hypothetical protein
MTKVTLLTASVVSLGYVMVAMVTAQSSSQFTNLCGRTCGEHGSCKPVNTTAAPCTTTYCQHKCVCDYGWTGDDCMLQYETCDDTITYSPDDARTCFNGGVCETYTLNNSDSSEVSKLATRCNCQTNASQEVAYAGHQCEYEAEEICVRDRSHSSYAFCTNNGTCKQLVDFGQAHPLCDCPTGFAGRHCQYTVDPGDNFAVPPDELEYINSLFRGNATTYGANDQPSYGRNDELSGGMKFLVVFLVAGVCCCIFCICCCYARKRRSSMASTDVTGQKKVNETTASSDVHSADVANDNIKEKQEII